MGAAPPAALAQPQTDQVARGDPAAQDPGAEARNRAEEAFPGAQNEDSASTGSSKTTSANVSVKSVEALKMTKKGDTSPGRAIVLLEACVDEDDESHLRILLGGKSIRYLTIAAGLYTSFQMCFGPTLGSVLPAFPPGDWNDGNVAKDPNTGQPHFAHTQTKKFPGVTGVWHPVCVDYLELTVVEKLRTGIYEATCSRYPSLVVAKFARFSWEVPEIDDECRAYQWIEGQGIGPKFLGHLTEQGRVIGFLMEPIANARHATPEDLELCQKILGKLHRLGVVHGDVNKHNFLIRGEEVTLIDFATTRKCDDEVAFQDEMSSLSRLLSDTSGIGEIRTISDRSEGHGR